MRSKYEVIEIDKCEITVDVSLLSKTDELFFNATEMAKPFSKQVSDFLRLTSTIEYMNEIFKEGDSPFKNHEDLVIIKKGKYGGTWLHKELAFEFAGWCSAMFRRKLHKWAEYRIEQEHEWQRKRLESKTGFMPLTNVIQQAHEHPKGYHFSNECNLINVIVLGMTAKEFKVKYEVENVRDALDASQLSEINLLQTIDTGLIAIGMSYDDRKDNLNRCHSKFTIELLEAA